VFVNTEDTKAWLTGETNSSASCLRVCFADRRSEASRYTPLHCAQP